MNRWYRSAPCKGILIVLEHILAAVIITCFMWGMVYPGGEYGKALTDSSKKQYADTKGFGKNMMEAAKEVLQNISDSRNLETKGVYDKSKIVDIQEFAEDGLISGEDKNGIAYRISDILSLEEQYGTSSKSIVVCKKPDDTYHYYEMDEFESLINGGKLIFAGAGIEESYDGSEEEDENYSYYTDSYLEALERGAVSESGNSDTGILDEDGSQIYVEYWNLNVSISDTIKTIDGKDLVTIANEEPVWNGRLQEAYQNLERAVRVIPSMVRHYDLSHEQWEEGNTNLVYMFVDMDRKEVYTNKNEYREYEEYQKNLGEITNIGKYAVVAPKLVDFKSNINTDASKWRNAVQSYGGKLTNGKYIYAVAIDTKYPIQDVFYTQNQFYTQYAPWMRVIIITGAASVAAFIIILMWLTIIAGRTKEDGELKLVWFDRLKTEIGAVVIVGLCSALVFCGVLGASIYFNGSAYMGEMMVGTMPTRVTLLESVDVNDMAIKTAVAAAAVTGSFALFLTGYLSLVRRLKARSLWSNSILRWVFKAIREIWSHRKISFKAMVSYLAFMMLHWICIAEQPGLLMLITFIVDLYVFSNLVRCAAAKQRLKTGIQRIAGGEVEYNIPLAGLKGDELDMAVRINNIGEGLNAAVEENMKNERLKTDLITNVSHDIKTPLTSIINYVDLLKRENIDDPKIQGYIAILEAKAQRLKTLTEDVVEASKISSGNIQLDMMQLNLAELVHQTEGEFLEKFEARDLKVVTTVSKEPAMIMADGRRMWRILANIFNNAAKYAMEGSRVYADLSVTSRNVIFSLKNVSDQPLNITADELTERFIRGDVSRSTEGSGLGLSIAKNLTELQGGEFTLYLDGDLFKATIVFPKADQKVEEESQAEPFERPH